MKTVFFLLLFVGCQKQDYEKTVIIFNGYNLSGEMGGGHNYQTGIVYDYKRTERSIIINAHYDSTPPQIQKIERITLQSGDQIISLDTVGENDTVVFPEIYRRNSSGGLDSIGTRGRFEIIKYKGGKK